MEAIKNSIVAHKGHLTRVLKSAKRLIPFAVLNPSPEVAHDLEDVLAGLRSHHAAIMSAYLDLGLVTVDPAAQAEQDAKMALVEDAFLQGLVDVEAASLWATSALP
jgi:chemotaxis protein histidine kinase CheA